MWVVLLRLHDAAESTAEVPTVITCSYRHISLDVVHCILPVRSACATPVLCCAVLCCIRTNNDNATDALRYDLAVVKLADSSIGHRTGWLGLSWDKKPYTGKVYSAGYPGVA